MARIDTLNNFLTDVANAIRDKKGTTDNIPASNFDTEIASIETSGGDEEFEPVVSFSNYNSSGYPTKAKINRLNVDDSVPGYLLNTPTQTSTYNHSILYYLKNIELPETTKRIREYSFYALKNLETINIPNTVTSIADYAFYGDNMLTLTELPISISNFGERCFYSCSNINITKIHGTNTSIKTYAFGRCHSITNLEIETSQLINLGAFGVCSNLSKVTFSNTTAPAATSYVFQDCSVLSTVVFPNTTNVPSIDSNTFRNTPIESGTGLIYVPDNLVEDFKSATNWSNYAGQIKPLSEYVEEDV